MKQDGDNNTAHHVDKSVQVARQRKQQRNLYEPYVTPRIFWELFMRPLVWIVLLLTMRLHLRNRYRVSRHGPYIIAANHLSWTDIMLIPVAVPGNVVYMAKEEAFQGKLGWLVRLLGAFPVKRGEADRQAMRAADDLLKKEKVLVIFPDGTRSKTCTLAKAHAGLGMIALRSGVPVLPVAVWGSEHALKKFRPQVTVCYGEPMIFKPKGAKMTREDIESATQEVMQRIAAMLPVRYRGVYGEVGDLVEQSQVESVQNG
jgi:1-acyl-sn-glycerol-3-phosphate acyltransferase